MKKIIKDSALFIARASIFLFLFYIVGIFAAVFLGNIISLSENLTEFLLGLSLYIPAVMALFFGYGRLCSIFSKSGWSIWLDGAFCGTIAVWGIVTVLATDIAKMMDGFLDVLVTGFAMPMYDLMNELTGDSINYYKYVFIAFWLLLAAIIFFGLRHRYIPNEKRRKANIRIVSIFVALIVAINIPTIINVFKPHMFEKADYPKIDGATAAIPLGETLAQELLGMDIIEAKRFVHFNTTHDAYENLIIGRADIIFVAEPSDEELALAAENGAELKLTPIGMDAFVFIVNSQNPVDSLTIEQIRGIYSGQITNWKDIDSATDRSIIAYQRPKNSGSQTLMENVVMKGLTIMEAPSEYKPGGMGGMMDAIDYQNSIDAIGYTVYYYASEMERRENVKFLAVNGVSCNKDTIRSGEYPFSGALYAVTRKDDESDATQKLLNHLLTDDGQRLVEAGGYVSVNMR